MKVQRICTIIDGNDQKCILRLYLAPIPQDLPRGEQYRYSHFFALELLSAALAADWALPHCRIARDEKGKPMLMHPQLYMNLSHCRGLAACGIATVPIGVDAEPPRAFKEHMLPRICAKREIKYLQQSQHPQKDFSRLWTLKEAYGKCTGAGIRLPLASIAFDCSGETIDFLHPAAEDHAFLQFLLPEDRTVAVCLAKPPNNLRVCCDLPAASLYSSHHFPKGAISYAEY